MISKLRVPPAEVKLATLFDQFQASFMSAPTLQFRTLVAMHEAQLN